MRVQWGLLPEQAAAAFRRSAQIVGILFIILLGIDISTEAYLSYAIERTLKSEKPLKEVVHTLFDSENDLYRISRRFQNYKNLNILILAQRVTGREYTEDYYGVIHALLIEHNERYARYREQMEMEMRISRDARFMLKAYESYAIP